MPVYAYVIALRAGRFRGRCTLPSSLRCERRIEFRLASRRVLGGVVVDRPDPGAVQHGDQADRPNPLILRIFSEVDQAGHHFWGRFAGELAARVIEPRLPIRVAAPSFWEPEGLSSSRELRARQRA